MCVGMEDMGSTKLLTVRQRTESRLKKFKVIERFKSVSIYQKNKVVNATLSICVLKTLDRHAFTEHCRCQRTWLIRITAKHMYM